MILQLTCFALIALLAVLRGPRALTRPEARPTWWASIAGSISLTTYGFPLPAALYDHLLGDQNLLTLLRDLSAVVALWFFRKALAGYAGSTRQYGRRRNLLAVLAVLAVLFLFVAHRRPTTATVVMNEIAQPAAWLYGTTYIAAVFWILLDSAHLTLRRRRGIIRLISVGALITSVGCGIELAVLTTAHFRWDGTVAQRTLGNASALPFFSGLAIMLTGIAATTVLGPARRRLLVSRLRRLSRDNLPASAAVRRPVLITSDRKAAAHLHQLLVILGNAQRAGTFNPTPEEALLIARAHRLMRVDQHFRPAIIRDAA